jgi:hypothetical protein
MICDSLWPPIASNRFGQAGKKEAIFSDLVGSSNGSFTLKVHSQYEGKTGDFS